MKNELRERKKFRTYLHTTFGYI